MEHVLILPMQLHLLYTEGLVSNSAELARSQAGLTEIDGDSALGATMAGFVSGPYTLF